MDSIYTQKKSTMHASRSIHAKDRIISEHVVSRLGMSDSSENVPFFGTASFFEDSEYIVFLKHKQKIEHDTHVHKSEQSNVTAPSFARSFTQKQSSVTPKDFMQKNRDDIVGNAKNISLREMIDLFSFSLGQWSLRTPATVFVIMLVFALGVFGGIRSVGEIFALKGTVLGESTEGYRHIQEGFQALRNKNFSISQSSFAQAHEKFSRASSDIDELSGTLVALSRYMPGASQLNSGKYIVDAVKELTIAIEALNHIVADLVQIKNPFDSEVTKKSPSLLVVFSDAQKRSDVAVQHLRNAHASLENVAVDDLPQQYRDRFISVKAGVPIVLSAIDEFRQHHNLITDLLGGNGLRQYLFLFQNNQEMRPTGGFIGSYGLLDIRDGYVENFFIDGIYNPDGQLTQKIVPPRPLQKISAAWSLHDSNWFADFPISAEKAISFYEKTGGPTVDGVITLTPEVMMRLLEITGPIHMEQYDVTLTQNNFIELTQYEVEEDFDKQKNRPKKILADIAPIILAKVLAPEDLDTTIRVIDVLSQSLREKHILIYMRDEDAQRVVVQRGWGGRILDAPHDYLSVVNTNINGFKTDGVIDEEISHESVIAEDGSIIDTVIITRTHNGGQTGRTWWDRVNTNYMRVYVPQGAELLSAEGHTSEVVEPRLDYDALRFRRDNDVVRQERAIRIHEPSGTRIYDESGKTVFGNWVYVSPQESTTVRYQYRLPFQLPLTDGGDQNAVAHSMLFQKQHGSNGSQIHSRITYPESYMPSWQTDYEDVFVAEDNVTFERTLSQDYFFGIIFERINNQ